MKTLYVFYNEDDHAVTFFDVVEGAHLDDYLEKKCVEIESRLLIEGRELPGMKSISTRRIHGTRFNSKCITIEAEVLLAETRYHLYDGFLYEPVNHYDPTSNQTTFLQ